MDKEDHWFICKNKTEFKWHCDSQNAHYLLENEKYLVKSYDHKTRKYTVVGSFTFRRGDLLIESMPARLVMHVPEEAVEEAIRV